MLYGTINDMWLKISPPSCCTLDKSSGQCEHAREMFYQCCLGGSWSLYLIKSQAVVEVKLVVMYRLITEHIYNNHRWELSTSHHLSSSPHSSTINFAEITEFLPRDESRNIGRLARQPITSPAARARQPTFAKVLQSRKGGISHLRHY